MKEFLEDKYGQLITNQFLTKNNEVIRDNFNKNGHEEQKEVIRTLKSLKNIDGKDLVPQHFFNNGVEWGFDFSSWIGNIKNKKLLIVGAEPHIGNNYQLVYDFGNIKGKTIHETALEHFNREADIWNYLTKIFVDDLTTENITNFLRKCYITDLCHIVPKHSGQVKDICKNLSIKTSDWNQFRRDVAKRFILKEIEIVNPEFVILHGNPSRQFFQNEFDVKDFHVYKVNNSHYTIQTWQFNGHKVISIPHLKGDVRNKLWKCKKYPERPASAKSILNQLIKQ